MLKKLFSTLVIALAMLCMLTACNNGNKPDDTNNPNNPSISVGGANVSDFQKNMAQSKSVEISNICEADNGYYLQYDAYVYYVDKQSKAAIVLCNKPDCRHSGSTCNAWVNAQSLSCYNGKLYYDSSDYIETNGKYKNYGLTLRKMELDGTKHDMVQALEFTVNGNGASVVNKPIIHRGVVYFAYCGALYGVPLGSEIKDAVKIWGEKAAESSGITIFNPNAIKYTLWADGDTVYFMVNLQQSDKTYKDTLFAYSPESGEVKQCWKTPNAAEVGTWEKTGVSPSSWYVKDNYIYYYLSGNDLWRTNLTDGVNEKIIETSQKTKYGSLVFTDEYICLLNNVPSNHYDVIGASQLYKGGDKLFIYNYDGSLIKEISLKSLYDKNSKIDKCSLLFASGNDIYFLVDASTWNNPINGIASANINLVLCCADISTGDLTQVFGWR